VEKDLTMTKLREGLPELPDRIKKLPLDPRGYPTPWFVAEVNGVRDFRMADEKKRVKAVKEGLCWLCGETLGAYKAFVIGPMCVVNRNTSEPPSHRECAEFAAQACPFLILPRAKYREGNLPEAAKQQPFALAGNPGACAIWISKTFQPYEVPGGWLIRIGEPTEVLWYCEGKPATREQIEAVLETRLPLLRKIAEEHGETEHLNRALDEAKRLLPA